MNCCLLPWHILGFICSLVRVSLFLCIHSDAVFIKFDRHVVIIKAHLEMCGETGRSDPVSCVFIFWLLLFLSRSHPVKIRKLKTYPCHLAAQFLGVSFDLNGL